MISIRFRRWLPRVLAVSLGFGAVTAFGQPPAAGTTPAPMSPMPMLKEPAKEAVPEKTVSFVFDEKPWKSVLEWFAKESGLVFYSTSGGMPQGSVTIKTDPARKYTLSQVVDLLNESLAPQNYIIVRRSQTFTVLPADQKIPKDLLPKITIEELSHKGDTEMVEVTFTLKMLMADEILPQIIKQKGTFGEIGSLGTNTLVISDTARNVRQIIKYLQDIENDKGNDAVTYQCKFIRAGTVAEKLKELLTDSSTQVTSNAAAPQYGYGGYGSGGYGGGGYYPPPDNRGRDSRGSSSTVGQRFKSVQISVIEATNTILITGPSDKLAAAKTFLKEIDVGLPGQKERTPGPIELRNYSVQAGTADAVAKTLQNNYKNSSIINITPLTASNQIMVYAPVADHFDIAMLINGVTQIKSGTVLEIIPITSFKEPKDIVDQLKRLYPDTGSGLQIDFRTDPTPALIVKGTQQQVDDIRAAYKSIDTGGGGGGLGSNMRAIPVTNTNAALVAEALANFLKNRGNPVDLKGTPSSTPPAPAPTPNPAPMPNGNSQRFAERGVQPVNFQIVDPAQPPKVDPNKKPVSITVVGGQIIIVCDDPETLDAASQLVRLLMSNLGKEVNDRFEIINLKNCAAEDAAKVIHELFNGPTQAQQGAAGGGRGGPGGGGGGGGLGGALGFLTQFAGIGASAPASPSAGRVRVVADKQSNSLIVVKASEGDLLMMKKLLEKAIDSGMDVTSTNYPKTHYVGLKYARAEEVKATLSEVFANLTTARSRGGAQQAMPFPFPIPGMQQQGGGSAEAQLTMSIDDRSNAIIVKCSDPIFEEVTKIVKILDDSAKNQTEVVQVVRLNGIDPALVEEAIRALSGQQAVNNRQGGGGTTGGFGGGSPFGALGGFGGGGLGGFGGGGNRGGFGGGQGGGTRGTGGGTRGTGGGTRGGRMNRADNISYDGGGGGRDFFEDRDMDVPSGASMIFDPENQAQTPPKMLPAGVQQVQYTPGLPVPQVPPMPMGGVQPPPLGTTPPPAGNTPPLVSGTTPAPIDSVTAEAIPGTDMLLLRAKNQSDMDAILRFIEFIRNPAKEASVEVQLIQMKNQDASSMVNILNTLFSRVSIGAGSTTIVPGSGTGNRGGGFGGGLGAIFGGGFGNQQSAVSGATTVGSIFMLPLPRFNAIMIAAPKSRLPDIMKEINRIDVPNDAIMSPTRFPLRKASAQNVAQQIQTFFNSRYGQETQAQNQIRVFFDAASNTVFVQASPADLKDISNLIEILDTGESKVNNELRIFRLKNAFSDEIAQVLYTAITSNSVNEALSNNAAGATTGTGQGGFGGQANNLAGGFGQNNQLGFGQNNQQNRLGTAGGFGGTTGTASATAGVATRSVSVQMYDADGKLVAETGVLQDVHITPDSRINSIIISAPAKTMRLIEKLIDQLDVPSAAQSDVKIYTLKKADATATATLIQQLFSRSTGTTGNQGGFGNLFGGNQGFGGANQQNTLRPIFNLTGDVSDGVNLIDLRLSVDVRTNSLIVGGSPSDLDTINAIIRKLEDSESTALMTKVYKLRNSAAADVQTALLAFMQQKLQADATVFSGGVFQTLNRTLYLQPEPVTNTLLIACAPQYFNEIVSLIEKMDAPPPQVFVQVLIAEVQLRNAEEFGMEFGIQSPVLFARSQTTAAAPGSPGFNFNTTIPPATGFGPGLPNNSTAGQGIVGFQGLGNLGVGRSGATGVGGFVFSAASDTFNLLIRALKAQSRIDVLSKPQMLLTDNQVGFFQVGQRYPIPGQLANTAAGVTTGVQYEDIGIVLRVTPRINPDGRVLMRVEPQITNPSPALINVGNGQLATAFDTETVTTTVLASDGETVVIGGLIRRSDTKTENKIPVLGDIPYLGAAFRYRTQNKERREVIFIVTPHLVRSEADMARVGAVETSKMGWVTKDVINVNTYGAALLTGQDPYSVAPDVNCYAGPPNSGSFSSAPLPGGILPDGPATAPGTPTPYPQPLPGGILPDSSKVPAPAGTPVSRMTNTPFATTGTPAPLPATVVQPAGGAFSKPAEIWPQDAAAPKPAQPAAPPRERDQWGVFKR